MNISRMAPLPLAGKRICIDPGHGGTDTGAIGPTGVREKDCNLAVALNVRDELVAQGATVVMTRDTDRNVGPVGGTQKEELQARCDVATDAKADIFVSIHSNAAPKPEPNGMETYHARDADDASKLLANSIFDSMKADIPLRPRGVFPANFYVIYHATMPAELTEVAFVTNPAEEKLLASTEFQKKAAHSIASGVVKYFQVAAEQNVSTARPPRSADAPLDPMPEDTFGFVAR